MRQQTPGTTIAGLARETRSIRLGTLVSPITFRLPIAIAKVAATVDQMSGGRVELGLGAGWSDVEHERFGIPFPPIAERFDRLGEVIQIVRGLWTEQRFSFSGVHYQVLDAACEPKPLQRPRDLLAPLTDADLSNDAFPFMAVRDILVGSVPVRALRVTYTGELGWELHHPIEYSRVLYDLLTEAGTAVGLADIGYRALDSLRLEKGYRLWGVDIANQYTPLEADLERFVRFDKGDFIGRDALVRQRDVGLTQTLACLTIDLDPVDTLFPRGGEPLLSGDELIGYLRAAHPGHAVGATIGLAYLPIALAAVGTRLEVEILGERRSVVVAEAPLYDPGGERMRGSSSNRTQTNAG